MTSNRLLLSMVVTLVMAACGPATRDPVAGETDAGDGEDVGDGGELDARAAADARPPSTIDAADPTLRCRSLPAVFRDFKRGDMPGGHADFQTYMNDRPTTGLVQATLDADRKPVLSSPAPFPKQVTDATTFGQWYRDVDGVNQKIESEIVLTADPARNGYFVFQEDLFFPLDGQGYPETMLGEDLHTHNFHFTTEIHTTFKYKGGEVFNFLGDDDLWLFINGHLVIDLGGLHGSVPGTVSLDAVAATAGLTIGEKYPMDVFHAERRADGSHFRIETTIDCFIIE